MTRLTGLLLFIIMFPNFAYSAVLFEDNFDSSPDWQSNQTISKSVPPGEDKGWPNTYKNNCQPGYCPPDKWTSYRTASSKWTDDRRRDTFVLNSEGARGGSGKGVTLNVESTGDYGTWAGGSLDLWLGEQGYQELYIRMYIQYTSEWSWSDGSQHGQQKLIRISTFNEDIATTSQNPHIFSGSSGINWPTWYPDWYYNANDAYEYAALMSSTRTAPTYITDGDETYSSARWPADTNWHCYEFHVKMNSAIGVADGVWEFYLDGNLKASRNNVKWKQTGANSKGWNWLMVLDNVTVAPFPLTEHKEMAIHMDDFVVSTNYIGPNYVIGGTTPSTHTGHHSSGTGKHLIGTGKMQ